MPGLNCVCRSKTGADDSTLGRIIHESANRNTMPDPIFEDPRLVAIYDTFDGNRSDLNAYLKILQDLNVRSVIDIGCGTGYLACLLIANNIKLPPLTRQKHH